MSEKQDLLTLFVDASFSPETRTAGYGAWAKRDGWPKGRFMGGFISPCRTSSDAELHAIARSVCLLKREGLLDGVQAILIQSDCLHALETIYGATNARISNHKDGAPVRRRGVRPSKAERAALADLTAATGTTRLIVRHVRGHKGRNTRETVNEICDRIAREKRLAAGRPRSPPPAAGTIDAQIAAAHSTPEDADVERPSSP